MIKNDRKLVDQALAARDAGDSAGAEELLLQGVRENPDSYVLWIGLGWLQEDRKDWDEAIRSFGKSTELNDNCPLGYTGIARCYARKEAWELAIANLQKSLDIDGTDDGFALMGDFQWCAGNMDAARASYEAALSIDPKCVAALINLGSLLRRESPDTAIAYIRKGMEVENFHVGAYLVLSEMLIAKGEEEEAEQVLREALRVCDRPVEARMKLGDMLVEQGRRDEARRLFEDVVKDDPVSFEAWMQLAKLHNKANPALSRECCRKAIELEPENADAWQALGGSFIQSEDFGEASKAFRKSLSLDGKNCFTYLMLSVSLKAEGKTKELEEVLRKAVHYGPDEVIVYRYWGDYLTIMNGLLKRRKLIAWVWLSMKPM